LGITHALVDPDQPSLFEGERTDDTRTPES
jgi:hypothetical protein